MRIDIHMFLALTFGFGCHTFLGLSASAQIPIPVDRALIPPVGFSFAGKWTCNDGANVAHLEVTPQLEVGKSYDRSIRQWTRLRESEQWFRGGYLIGFDRDHSRFLQVDSKDPAVQQFRTKGWTGNTITLESISNQEGPLEPVRIEYQVASLQKFIVIWKTQIKDGWKADPAVACRRIGSR
jgi:hypothetical protein